jgi:orotate phosphoribosyltransferase
LDLLAKKIRNISYLEGEFILRSGQKSNYYLDKYLFGTNSEILNELSDAFAKKIKENYLNVDLLAAPELGAVSIVSAISIKTGLNFVIIRKSEKDYGTTKLIEGKIDNAKNILLIEDILTTAGAAISSANIIRKAGYNVVAIFGTIDRLQGAKENIIKEGFNYDTLFTIKDLQ